MAIFTKGSIGLFFRGDPTIVDYFVFDNRATNYGSSLHHGTPSAGVRYVSSELLPSIPAVDFLATGYIDLGLNYDWTTPQGTIMFWQKLRDNTTQQTLFCDGSGVDMYLNFEAGYWRSDIYDSGISNFRTISVSNTYFTPNRKQLITMTWAANGYLKVYVDAQLIGQVSILTPTQGGQP